MPTLELERKAAGGLAAGVVNAQDEGVVEAIVSVTGVVDNVGDLILPGAYAETLAARTPKGFFNHDDKVWVARTEHVEELLPGDPRLRAMAAEAKIAWPAEAGALYVKMRFNLETKDGREAFSNVRFYDREQEWSIGYRVPRGGGTRDAKGIRRIKRLDLFEYSPVPFGANSQTYTLSVKSALGDGDDLPGRIADCLRDGAPLEVKRELIRQARETDRLGMVPMGWRDGMDAAATLEDLAFAVGREVKADRADAGSGVMVALMLPAEVAGQLAVPDGMPAEELHVTLAYLGKDLDEEMLATVADIVSGVAAGVAPLPGRVGGIGAFPPGEDGVPVYVPVDVPGLEVLRQQVVDRLAKAGIAAASDHGYSPHVTLTYLPEGEVVVPEPVPALEVAFGEVSVVRGGELLSALPLGEPAEAADTEPGGDGGDGGGDGWDDLLDATDVGEGGEVGETKDAQLGVARAMGFPVPVSLEEVRDQLRQAVTRWARSAGFTGWVNVVATFADVAFVCVHDDAEIEHTVQVPYEVTPAGQVTIGEPVPAEVTMSGVPDEGALVAVLEETAAAVKHLGVDVETKAGRVLSSATAKDLRQAVASLLAVFRRAGIDISDPTEPDERHIDEEEVLPDEPTVRPDSTAPSALPTEMKALSPEMLAEAAEITAAALLLAVEE
ncbi:2'-5' RNA ligase family protein [Nonomuraea sp. CA-143628]|uniref:2'-5' RNA ligase family protein n=1 Tax=Nonomuraea sp. CA-143628 TaxID=3239997 RepID=UPI003D8AFA94